MHTDKAESFSDWHQQIQPSRIRGMLALSPVLNWLTLVLLNKALKLNCFREIFRFMDARFIWIICVLQISTSDLSRAQQNCWAEWLLSDDFWLVCQGWESAETCQYIISISGSCYESITFKKKNKTKNCNILQSLTTCFFWSELDFSTLYTEFLC